MAVKSIEVSEDFYTDIKMTADKHNKSVAEELEYLVSLGRQKAIDDFYMKEIELGLEECNNGQVVSHEEVMKLLYSKYSRN